MADEDDRLVSIDITESAGEKFPTAVRAEVERVAWGGVKPAVIGAGADAAAAREAIDAVSTGEVDAAVVAKIAADSTPAEAAAAAVAEAVDTGFVDAFTSPDSALRAYLDMRYAPYSVGATIGDGTSTTFDVTHIPFGDVLVQLQLVATREIVGAKVTNPSSAVTRIVFREPPATDSIRVQIQGIGSFVEVADTEPPTAPGQPAASSITGLSVALAWDAATDNVSIVLYKVYRADGLGADFEDATLLGSNGLTRTYTDSTVVKSADYTYFVTATDYSLNEGPASAGEDVTTLSYAGIDPTTRTDLVSDFDAADMGTTYANGDAISSWAPTAGSETTALAQATSGNRPLFVSSAKNSLPAVDFVSVDSMTVTDWSISKGVIYGVVSADALAGSPAARNVALFGTIGTAGTYRYVASLTGGFGAGIGVSGGQAVATITTSTWYAFVAKFMGGTTGYKLWLNAISATPTAVSTAGPAIAGNVTGFIVGDNGANFPWDGKMAQIGVLSCDTAEVTDADCGQIAQFLMDKYAIT